MSSALYLRARTGILTEVVILCTGGSKEREREGGREEEREIREGNTVSQINYANPVGVRSRLSSREKFCTFGKFVSSSYVPRDPFLYLESIIDAVTHVGLSIWFFESGASHVEKFYTIDVIGFTIAMKYTLVNVSTRIIP